MPEVRFSPFSVARAAPLKQAFAVTNINVAASIDFMTIFPSIDAGSFRPICLFGDNGTTVRQTQPGQRAYSQNAES
jgi:hypothetical protein